MSVTVTEAIIPDSPAVNVSGSVDSVISGSVVHSPFKKEKETYYGMALIDSVEKLQGLMDTSKNTIWIVTNHQVKSALGEELRGFIEANFDVVFERYKRKVYKSRKVGVGLSDK